LRCLVTHKQGSVMHIPGPPTHIVTHCLINSATDTAKSSCPNSAYSVSLSNCLALHAQQI
jgi:hypothetical protein